LRQQKNRRRDNNEQSGLSVEVRNGDFNFALRKFKKKVQESGILQELREREYYTKPSLKRKKAKAAGRARWLKKLEKMEQALTQPKKKR
jgi:small subunit ribosomal protein S21